MSAHVRGPLWHSWLAWSHALFCLVGLRWIPVVWLQISVRDLARESEKAGALTKGYWNCARLWFWLGVPAFPAMIVVFWLMVVKPSTP
jgi:uncharacterized membrane protein